jgi:hypothetical protein
MLLPLERADDGQARTHGRLVAQGAAAARGAMQRGKGGVPGIRERLLVGKDKGTARRAQPREVLGGARRRAVHEDTPATVCVVCVPPARVQHAHGLHVGSRRVGRSPVVVEVECAQARGGIPLFVRHDAPHELRAELRCRVAAHDGAARIRNRMQLDLRRAGFAALLQAQ